MSSREPSAYKDINDHDDNHNDNDEWTSFPELALGTHRRSYLVVVQRSKQALPSKPHVALHPSQVGGEPSKGPLGRPFEHPRPVFRHPLTSFRPIRVLVLPMMGTKQAAKLDITKTVENNNIYVCIYICV